MKFYFFFAVNGVWVLLIFKILMNVLINDSSVHITFCSEENPDISSDDSAKTIKQAETTLGIVKVTQEITPGINIDEDVNQDDCHTIKSTIDSAVGQKMKNIIVVCDLDPIRNDFIKEKISDGLYEGMKEGVAKKTKLNPQDVQETQDDSDSDSSGGCHIS